MLLDCLLTVAITLEHLKIIFIMLVLGLHMHMQPTGLNIECTTNVVHGTATLQAMRMA